MSLLTSIIHQNQNSTNNFQERDTKMSTNQKSDTKTKTTNQRQDYWTANQKQNATMTTDPRAQNIEHLL